MLVISHYRYFFILVSILAGKALANRDRPQSSAENPGRLMNVLFGNLWKFDQYCGESRESKTITRDDIEIQSFYNGTKLDSLADISEFSFLGRSNELNYLGIKSRSTNTILCSINNWGYAEEDTFNLSNQPFDNETECLKSIDKLYDALNFSNTGKVLAPFCAKNPENYTQFTTNIGGDSSFIDCRQFHKVSNRTINEWIQLNSFGRAPSGLLWNSHMWLGDYNSCTKLPGMRYCLGSYRMNQWPPDDSPNMMNAYRIGLCLPRICNSRLSKSKEYVKKLDKLVKFNLIHISGFDEPQTYQLDEIYCPPANDSLYRNISGDFLSKLLLIIALVWLFLLSFATCFNLAIKKLSKKSPHRTLIDIFDLKASWANFKYETHIAPELAGVNAIKVIHFIWLMFSHMYMLFASFCSNRHEMRDLMHKSYFASILLQGNHAVPIFFIISGLLVGHKHLRGRSLNVMRFIMYRYIRLLPMYLVVYAYVKKFSHLLGDGPIWDHGVSIQSEARQCRMESWLVPILMLANFIPPFAHCILSGWHIANDFQLFLLAPLLLAAYRYSRLLGRLVAVSSFLLSHLYHVWNYHSVDRWSFETYALEPHIFGARVIMDRLSYDYVNPIGRFGTLFSGILLADLGLNCYKKPSAPGVGDQSINLHDLPKRTDKRQSSKEDLSTVDSSDIINDNNNTNTNGRKSTCGSQTNVATCGIACSNTTVALVLNFKDKLIFVVGSVIFLFVLFCCAYTPGTKFFLRSYSKAFTYPTGRLLIELGEFLLLYVLLRANQRQVQVNHKQLISRSIGNEETTPSSSIAGQQQQQQQRTQSSLNAFVAVGNFFKKPIWDILVKLNYSLMLVHFTIARYLIQSQVQLLTFSWLNYFQYSTFLILLSYLVCCLVHLAVEMPLGSLIKLLVNKLDCGKFRMAVLASEKRQESSGEPPVGGPIVVAAAAAAAATSAGH